MTQPVATAQRPAAPAKNTLPTGVVVERYWRETPDGPAVRHDHERPVDEATEMPVGMWWMCPADPACKTGEWVFPRADGVPARPKKRGCPDHVCELLPGRSEPTDDDPKQAARGRLQQAIAAKRAAARKAATDATQARINALRAAGREEALRMQSNLREHVPSAAVSLAALVTDWALNENLGSLETYALGTGLAVGGAVLAYLAIYSGEIVYARRMGYTLRELPASVRARARSHARWIAAGVLSTGAWLVIGETIGARLDNWQGVVANLIAAVMIGVVNYNPWATMVQRRKDEARAAQEAAETAARTEEDRLSAIKAERDRRRQAAEDAKRAAEEAALNEANKIVRPEDDRITAGRKFAARWTELAEAAKAERSTGPGFEIWRTEVVVEETRKLTTKAGGDEIVIGHEFLIRAQPGVLPPRAGSNVSPFVAMKPWLVSMLELRSGMVDLMYQPIAKGGQDAAEPEKLINHGLVTLYDSHPLAEDVDHPGPSGVHIDEKGIRWGFAGRDLRGRDVYRKHWIPGQAGGGIRVGVTGMGKSVVTQVTAYNDLLLGILPIIHDAGKNAMDFVDFYGICPVGHTIEHREVIRESLWAEMKRRQAWNNTRTTIGLNGMEVHEDPQWDPAVGGPLIRAIWEEFHMHTRDPNFISYFGSQVRLQRATGIFAEGATQGSGLADWADQNLKEQMAEILLQMMRVSDHTARVSGYSGGLMPSSLPALPGMLVMQEFKGDPIAYRSAFIPRKRENPKSLAYRLREPDGTLGGKQIVFAPQLPAETVAIFKQYGLMDLWEMGKTKSGRAQLQAEADPVGSTVYPPAVSAALTQTAPVVKPKLRADDVIVAMLKHHLDAGQPFLTQTDMLGSQWWRQVDGEWSKTEAGVPQASTISRAVGRLSAGDQSLIIKDDSEKQARWSLLPAGIDRADQMLTILASAGVLGPQAQARVRGQAQTDGVDIAEMERRVMLEAEQESLMRELLREAAAGLQQPGAS